MDIWSGDFDSSEYTFLMVGFDIKFAAKYTELPGRIRRDMITSTVRQCEPGNLCYSDNPPIAFNVSVVGVAQSHELVITPFVLSIQFVKHALRGSHFE